jgi:hypothetical protein
MQAKPDMAALTMAMPNRINDDTQGDGVLFGCNGMIDWNDDGATQPATIDDTRI